MLHGKQCTGAAKAGLYFVGDQQNAVFVTDFAQTAHEFGWCCVETAFALNRFEDDRGHACRVNVGFENMRNGVQGVLRAHAVQFHRIGCVEYFGRERAKACFVRHDFTRQGQTHHGATMKTAGKGNHAGAACVGTRNFDRVFHGFCTGGEEGGFGRSLDRRGFVHAFGQANVGFVWHDLIAGVGEMIQLLGNRGDLLGMAMAGIDHGNAAAKVDVAFAFNVPDFGVFGTLSVKFTHHTHTTWGSSIFASE